MKNNDCGCPPSCYPDKKYGKLDQAGLNEAFFRSRAERDQREVSNDMTRLRYWAYESIAGKVEDAPQGSRFKPQKQVQREEYEKAAKHHGRVKAEYTRRGQETPDRRERTVAREVRSFRDFNVGMTKTSRGNIFGQIGDFFKKA